MNEREQQLKQDEQQKKAAEETERVKKNLDKAAEEVKANFTEQAQKDKITAIADAASNEFLQKSSEEKQEPDKKKDKPEDLLRNILEDQKKEKEKEGKKEEKTYVELLIKALSRLFGFDKDQKVDPQKESNLSARPGKDEGKGEKSEEKQQYTVKVFAENFTKNIEPIDEKEGKNLQAKDKDGLGKIDDTFAKFNNENGGQAFSFSNADKEGANQVLNIVFPEKAMAEQFMKLAQTQGLTSDNPQAKTAAPTFTPPGT